jgi:uncharacterized protein YceK
MKRALVGALAALSLSGCGTVCNLAGGIVHPESEPKVYGGVQRDLTIIEKGYGSTMTMNQKDDSQGGAALALTIIAVAVLDPVLSFVGDTVTLPITIPLQRRRFAAEQRSSGDVEASPKATAVGATLGPPRPASGAAVEVTKDPASPE